MGIEGWVALGALVVSVAVAVINGRSAILATRIRAQQDALVAKGATNIDAGELALKIALGAQARLDQLATWWPEHEKWDDSVEEELRMLDPDAVKRLAPRPRPPFSV